MRADGLLASLLLVLALAVALPAFAQDGPPPGSGDPAAPQSPEGEPRPASGHGTKAPDISLSELSPTQRREALDAWAHVYCACPEENWSRTLANCPDGCSFAQKQEILRQVLEGWSLDAIVEEQVKRYGPRANADPGTGGNGTLLVAGALLIGAGVAGWVLARWQRAAVARRAAASSEREARPIGDDEVRAVEAELQEIE